MPQPSSVLDRAGCWFLNSGIQEPGGGVARYYRTDLARNARVSTEITGYAVSALVYLFLRTGREEYLAAATRAADFLVLKAWDREHAIFPFEYDSNGQPPEPLAYFFDSGIIARGLLALWRATRREQYLAAAAACGDSMARDFAAGERIHPVLRLPEKTALPYEPRWSRSPGCYQLKAAMAWRELELATADPLFGRLYHEAVAAFLPDHTAFLAAEPDRREVMNRLHAYCYFLEGLLPCASRPDCAAALAEGIRLAGDLLRDIRPEFERSDVHAQLLRVRLLAAAAGRFPLLAARAALAMQERMHDFAALRTRAGTFGLRLRVGVGFDHTGNRFVFIEGSLLFR